MAQKDGIKVCFRIVFVVLVVAVLAQSSCIEDTRARLEKAGGRALMGGFSLKKDPLNDAVVKGIVDTVVQGYNGGSNSLCKYELPANGNVECYQQVVRGLKYCMRFTLVSDSCKHGINSPDVNCSNGKTVTCTVTAYKDINNSPPAIDPPTCTEDN